MSTTTENLNTIVTKLGTLSLTPTEADHIYAEGYLTVRGKRMRATLHLYRWSDGQFHAGMETEKEYEQNRSIYLSNPDDINDNGTAAFRGTVKQIVPPVVNEWANANVATVDAAETRHRGEAIANRRSQVEAHQAAIKQLEGEIARLLGGEHLPSYSEVKAYR